MEWLTVLSQLVDQFNDACANIGQATDDEITARFALELLRGTNAASKKLVVELRARNAMRN